MFNAVSLFSNCGAGDLGYRNAGFTFRVLAEIDRRRLEVAALNHPGALTVLGDLRQTWPAVVRHYREMVGHAQLDLLAACPPCQGISSARGGRGRGNDPDAGAQDGRNLLVVPIARVAKALEPRAIVVENVPAFFSRLVRHPETHEPVSAAQLLVQLLEQDYVLFPVVTDLADYGVPQTRRRAFMTLIRRGEPGLGLLASRGRTPYPRPTHLTAWRRRRLTASSALKRMSLPTLDAVTPALAGPPARFPMHFVPVWSDRLYAMVEAIPPGSGKSAWQSEACGRCGPVVVGRSAATCPRCRGPLLRPVVKSRNGRWRLVRGFGSSYRRMAPHVPAATVTTASGHIGSDITLHPFQHRVLSPLECARLQTFPAAFRWGRALNTWGHTFVRDIIGEAVPPRFTERHGRALLRALSGRVGPWLLAAEDVRARRARKRFKTVTSLPP
jgi:DNA (cytosine-5)-methyltransferase 1